MDWTLYIVIVAALPIKMDYFNSYHVDYLFAIFLRMSSSLMASSMLLSGLRWECSY